MKDFKFRITNAEDFKGVQEYLFSEGYEWYYAKKEIQEWIYGYSNGLFNVTSGGYIQCMDARDIHCMDAAYFERMPCPEYELMKSISYSLEPVKVRKTVVIGDKVYYLDELEVAIKNIKPIIQ